MDISVVVPIMNEESSLEELFKKLKDVLEKLSAGEPDKYKKGYEIIFVDDGSTDGSFEILKRIAQKDEKVRVIKFRANFGQTAALSAGFKYALGDVIITIDADLQNDPEDIPKLLKKMDEGYDVVSGWRRNRHDPFLNRRLPSFFANKIISRITGVRLHDYGCTLKAYRKEIVGNIDLYGQMHRFLPALAKWVGASVGEVEVRHFPRKYGRSKYGISRTVAVILDLVTVRFLMSYSTKPIQIFGLIGIVSGGIGFIMGVWLVVQRQFFGMPLSNRPILLLAVLLMFVGIQFISMGLLGEMQVRTYHESQDKPIYVIKETLN